MPLDIAGLSAAGCGSSKNPILQQLWEAVTHYNQEYRPPDARTPAQSSELIGALDFIYCCCAKYMTEKTYKDQKDNLQVAKRKLRYEAFERLIENVAGEMEASGAKMLTGPANFRQIDNTKRSYWLERVDPDSRAGYELSDKYAEWQRIKSPMTFWQWLARKNPATGAPELHFATHVKGYNNADGAQWEHCVYFDHGALRQAMGDSLFNTGSMSTETSGTGWGVFVCSTPIVDGSGNYGWFAFSYTHRAGFDHHSSFLGGQPVLAAGEWIVDGAGAIHVITAKSGHYMPQWRDLHNFVKKFDEVPGDAIIRPNLLDLKDADGKVKFYLVQDFRTSGLQARPLGRAQVVKKVKDVNPSFDVAPNLDKNKGWINRLP